MINVLAGLGIEYESDARVIEAWNKTDLLPLDDRLETLRRAKFAANTVAISAITGEGTDTLLALIEQLLSEANRVVSYKIPVADGRALAWLHENAHVLNSEEAAAFMTVTVEIAPENLGRFAERFSYKPEENMKHDEKRIYGG